MPGKIDWIQLLILLIVFGGGIIRFIVQSLTSGKEVPDQGKPIARPKSPAVEILEKLRENEEAIATRQAQAPSSAPKGGASNPEDAYFGDDGLEGVPALQASEVPAIRPGSPAEDVAPAAKGAQPAKKRRSGDRIPGTIRDPREEVLHPHSMDIQTSIALPSSSETQVRQQDLEIGEELAVHTSTQSRRQRTGRRSLPAALGVSNITLRQAVIGQVILGPPKALEARGAKRSGLFSRS